MKFVVLLFLGVTLTFIYSFADLPKAENGIIDLRNWNFEKDGNIKLDGNWEFYYNQFLKYNDFDTIIDKHYILVPYTWTGYIWNGQKLSSFGFASNRLKLLMPKKMGTIAFKVPDQGTAFEFYINDSLICKNGKIGKTKATSKPQYLPQVVSYNYYGDTITISILVSNFHYHAGGIFYSIEAGDENKIKRSRDINISIEIFIAGATFLVLIVFFCFYLLKRNEKSYLYFSLMNLLILIRNITTGQKTITLLFPNISFELIVKLETVSWMFWACFGIVYIYELFKQDFSNKIKNIVFIIYLIFPVITIFSPASVFSYLIPYGSLMMLLVGIFILILSGITIKNKREGSFLSLIGFLFMFLSGIYETAYYRGYIPKLIPINVNPVGMGLWSLTQIILLSLRSSSALRRIENFSNELQFEVKQRTKELREEKIKSDKLLLNVLPEPIAEKLKEGENKIAEHFDEVSIVFIDIVDFTYLSSKIPAQDTVELLNNIFTKLDKISERYGLEKIKTIGDCYMAVAGVPWPKENHAELAAHFALEALQAIKSMPENIDVRIGIDCGPVVAGVIGEKKFIYDLWGDAVNTAARMEEYGIPGEIHVTDRFKKKFSDYKSLSFTNKGDTEIKGKGLMQTWLLEKSYEAVST